MEEVWRYVPRGEVKHRLRCSTAVRAVCGFSVWTPSDWFGTGSQLEYERVDELPECQLCLKRDK